MKNRLTILRAAAIGLALVIAQAFFTSCWDGLDEVLAKRGKRKLNGAYGWTKRLGGTDSDSLESIVTDRSGNIYVVGLFKNTVNFRADWDEISDEKISAGDCDIFITKINSNLSYGWTKRIGSSIQDYPKATAIDDAGNIYVCGQFYKQLDFRVDWNDGQSDVKTNKGSGDIFVTKINANGTYGWTRRIGGEPGASAESIFYDGVGNIYVSGWFYGTVNFREDWEDDIQDTKTSAGLSDTFIMKILL